MRTINKLTDRKVRSLTEPGRYADGGGLYLQIAPGGSRQWLFRYMLNGSARAMGLGSLNTFSLAEARERAKQQRQLLADKTDPIEKRLADRDARDADARSRITFKEAAIRFIDLHDATWSNRKHRGQWRSTLEQYAFHELGHRPVSAIDGALVTRALAPIWQSKPVTAGRVKQRIERVLDWVRNGMPLPMATGRNVQHFAAMDYRVIPEFMQQLRTHQGTVPRAIEFLILTAARSGEVIGATWSEIDMKARSWTIPAARMKGGKEHRAPLCDRAVAILENLPREEGNPYVFVGGKAGQPLGHSALRSWLIDHAPGVTIHGFRSSFRDWVAERTSYPNHVAEMALAHTVKGVEGRYRRGDLFDKRRKLMDAWAQYCAAPAGGNVVAIHRKA